MQRILLCTWFPFHFWHAFIFTISLGVPCSGFPYKVHSLVLLRFVDCYTTSAFCLSARAKRTLGKSRCYRTQGGAYQGKACWTAEKTKGKPMGSLRRTLKEHMLKRTEICGLHPQQKHGVNTKLPDGNHLEDAQGKAGRSHAKRKVRSMDPPGIAREPTVKWSRKRMGNSQWKYG